MKYLILLVAVLSFTNQSLADSSGADAVVLVSIDEIREGKGDLSAKKTVSAGQPDSEVLAKFAAAGYVAVVDLRTDKEDRGFDEPVTVMGLGMSYVSMPIDSEQSWTKSSPVSTARSWFTAAAATAWALCSHYTKRRMEQLMRKQLLPEKSQA